MLQPENESVAPPRPLSVGHVAEAAVRILTEQHVALVGQVRDDNVGAAVVVVIGEVDAHAREGLAVLVEADACDQADLREGSVALVVEQKALNRIVGDVDVGEAVVVVVGERDAQPLARRLRDGRRGRHIGERPIAVVVEQQVGHALEVVRMAVRPVARLFPAAVTVVLKRPLHVARDEQIEAAVVVVVEEAGAGAPAAARDAGPASSRR